MNSLGNHLLRHIHSFAKKGNCYLLARPQRPNSGDKGQGTLGWIIGRVRRNRQNLCHFYPLFTYLLNLYVYLYLRGEVKLACPGIFHALPLSMPRPFE